MLKHKGMLILQTSQWKKIFFGKEQIYLCTLNIVAYFSNHEYVENVERVGKKLH